MSDVTDRFIEVYNHLLSNKIIAGAKDMSEKIDVSTSMITEILKGRSNVGVKAIQNTVSVFSISPSFLLSGIGTIYESDKNVPKNVPQNVPLPKKNAQVNAQVNAHLLDKIEKKTETKTVNEAEVKYTSNNTPERHLIPFYDIQAIAGRHSGADMTPVIASTEMIDAGDWFHDATAAMRIYGDSMMPDYKSGSIVALKEVYDKRIILYGDDYVIETDEIRVLKRLQRADERGCWLACSTNQEIWEQGPQKGKLVHEPFEVPIDMVRRLYLVVGEVNRKHGNIINFNER